MQSEHATICDAPERVDEVDDDDLEDAVEPVLRRETAKGRKVRLLYLMGRETRVHGVALDLPRVSVPARFISFGGCGGPGTAIQ
jgi:hypothetical protein